MSAANVPVNAAFGSATQIQTFLNTIGGQDVHAQAITLVDTAGTSIPTLPVSIAGSVNVNATQVGDVKSSNASNFLVTASIGSNATIDLERILGTTIDVNSGGKSGGTQRVILATDQTNVPITVQGTVILAANSSFNETQVLGTTIDVNSGNKSAGTQRVILATDQPNVPVTLQGTATLGANSSFNLNQVLGTTVDVNSGTKSAGTQRVILASDQTNVPITVQGTPGYNLSQVGGTAVSTSSSGVQQVGVVGHTGASLETTSGIIDINQKRVADGVTVASVTGVQDVTPRLRDGSTGLSPKWFIQRISTQLNTFPTNATAYIESIKIMVGAGTAAAFTVRDQSGSGNITLLSIPNIANVSSNGILENYMGTFKCTGGININTTGGASPSDVNVWMKYWQ